MQPEAQSRRASRRGRKESGATEPGMESDRPQSEILNRHPCRPPTTRNKANRDLFHYSLFRYLSRKVVTASLLGFLLLTPVISVYGAFDDLVLNDSLGMMGRESDKSENAVFSDDVDGSTGRMLVSTTTNNGEWVKGGINTGDMISVRLRKTTGVAYGSVKQEHLSSRDSVDEIPALLHVLRNGKNEQIKCHLIADKEALANWMQKSYQSGEDYGEQGTTEMHGAGIDKSARKELTTGVAVAIASAIFVALWLCVAAGFMLWCMCWKGAEQNELSQEEPIFQLQLCGQIGPRRFRYHELATATDNFADEKKLGQGGFGQVYHGYLRNQDCHVAIKVLSKESAGEGLEEFEAEVKVMTQLRHRNIVRLLGWCDSNQRYLLVYELMAEGSLDKHLYDPEKKLTWEQRYNILLGLGSGLLYLHQDCEKCIVHGDIKPANVMLDASYNAKLGDFGQARTVEHGVEPQPTEIVAGTRGYIDPEFINNRLRCPETDIYSFGVALLEIACGKRPTLRHTNGGSMLLAWVRDLYGRDMILDAADRRLSGEFDQPQMERVLVTGLWCAHPDPSQRPSIAQAMYVLRPADAYLPLPVLPATRDGDALHIRSLEEQAYGNLTTSADDAVAGTTFHTCKDSAYLRAQE